MSQTQTTIHLDDHDSTENIQVLLRVRPLNQTETINKERTVLAIEGESVAVDCKNVIKNLPAIQTAASQQLIERTYTFSKSNILKLRLDKSYD